MGGTHKCLRIFLKKLLTEISSILNTTIYYFCGYICNNIHYASIIVDNPCNGFHYFALASSIRNFEKCTLPFV